VQHLVRFHALDTVAVTDVPESAVARMICYILLARIPDEGTFEALDALATIYRFYATPALPAAEPPAAPRIPIKLQEPYVRPVFPVTEE
jgi:hypothetical protein